LWLLAVALEFVAFLLGGINFLTTAMNARAPGMTAFRLPIFIWMTIVAVIVFMASVGPLVAGAIMLLFDQVLGTRFYDPQAGGDPLLWQHLFWFFGHPEVYVVLLPAMGVVAEVITVFARKKLFAYKTILYTTFATGVLSFLVWAHHQFVAGIDPRMAHLFTVMTLLISVPISEIVFSYIATLYGGSIEFKTPMLWALAFVAEFLLGGVTGIFLGSSGTDIYLHDTYFVLAHFHYTFFPIAIIAGFAGIYYWFPKMFGRMLNETLGKIHFWGTIIGFNCTFIPLFITGLAGDHRRIYNYEHFSQLATPGFQELRIIATIGAIITLLSQIPFIVNVVKTLREGEKAQGNPWRANTLEWQVPSPPPHGNFAAMPTVHRGAYEYGTPGRSEDYWPQHHPA
jgi:cytochrome c oxidase subunit 1